jgi:predicted O-linked N-acetylglucosamine transferase (SPINDLY family)
MQVSYLYVGTMSHVDYILADEVASPPEQQPFYIERIAHVPECYFPYDPQVSVAERVPTRQEAGLPERGFVFSSFNNSWKITPAMCGSCNRTRPAFCGCCATPIRLK